MAKSAFNRLADLLPLLFGSTILSSACLLFLVQPLISKMILPWFGGSAAIWVTAMLFFQTCLLLGYVYAHFLTQYASPKKQVLIHTFLLVISFGVLPLSPSSYWLPQPGEDPTWAVFKVLGTCVGLPYMLLSSTSPLIQKWFSLRSRHAIPYRYFALSNAGSLLALFAFPLLIETRFTGHQQSYLWSGAFVVFALLCALCALLQLQNQPLSVAHSEAVVASSSFGLLSLWTGLGACASALLLIVTSLLTQNIAPMPLLWVVPLGIYLLTFILCFESSIWYRRWLFLPVTLPALAYVATAVRLAEDDDNMFKTVPLLLGAFFLTCMACHGELSRLKPEPSHLTSFYLAIAVGGAIGGLAVALIAPHIFNANWEDPIVLTATGLILLIPSWRDRHGWKYPRIGMSIWLAAASCCVLLAIYSTQQFKTNLAQATYMARNFYGSLRVDEMEDDHRHIRQLAHGTITHGNQFMDPPLNHVATTYYGRESGAGLTYRILESSGPINMGVVGLGAGTMAAYGRGGDHIRFYDINPLVMDIAQHRFSFISDSPAKVDFSLGDARLILQQQPPQQYDLLIVDAFSGDAIPVHLLTAEAYRLYWKHLKPDGVLAFHVSNRYLNLAPVVAAIAAGSGKEVRNVDNEDDDKNEVFTASYVLITSRPDFFANPLIEKQAATIKLPPGARKWTDDYSNLWQALHLQF